MHLGSEKLLIDRQTNEESTEEKSCTKPSDMVHPHLLINYVSSNIVPLYIINIKKNWWCIKNCNNHECTQQHHDGTNFYWGDLVTHCGWPWMAWPTIMWSLFLKIRTGFITCSSPFFFLFFPIVTKLKLIKTENKN